MSETEQESTREPAELPGPAEPAIPLAVFADSLRPKILARDRRGRATKFDPGSPDEIWIKLLRARHGIERHTVGDWNALIDRYRGQPAHTADPRFKRGN